MIEQQPEIPDQTTIAEAGKNPNWVPWTAQQTFRAVLVTLIPWIGFSLLLVALEGNSTSAPSTRPLSVSEDLTGALVAIIFTALVEGAFLIAPFYYANKALTKLALAGVQSRVRAVFRALGLRRFNVLRALPVIIGLMVLITAINLLYSYAITILHLNIQTNDQVVLQQSASQPLTTYGLLLASVFIAPFCEEIFFRGFVFTGLLRELSPVWAMLVSSALFAIAHADPGSFIPLFAIGLCLAFLRWRTGSTWASMTLHILNNLLSSALIILAMHNLTVPF